MTPLMQQPLPFVDTAAWLFHGAEGSLFLVLCCLVVALVISSLCLLGPTTITLRSSKREDERISPDWLAANRDEIVAQAMKRGPSRVRADFQRGNLK